MRVGGMRAVRTHAAEHAIWGGSAPRSGAEVGQLFSFSLRTEVLEPEEIGGAQDDAATRDAKARFEEGPKRYECVGTR